MNGIIRQVMVFFRKDQKYNVLLVSLLQEKYGNMTDKSLYNQAMLNPKCKLVYLTYNSFQYIQYYE